MPTLPHSYFKMVQDLQLQCAFSLEIIAEVQSAFYSGSFKKEMLEFRKTKQHKKP